MAVPPPRTDALQAIGDARDTGAEVIVELVGVALVGPVPDNAPFKVYNQRPFIETTQA